MPRGRKKKPESIEGQIELVQNEIDALSTQLKEKKKALSALEKAKEAEEQQKLLDAVTESGKSIDDVIALLGK